VASKIHNESDSRAASAATIALNQLAKSGQLSVDAMRAAPSSTVPAYMAATGTYTCVFV
jgi:hypothetical protein